ncbi:MAG: hypothetical protein COY81_01725 [Candidatus Pacebacteria bacterium CG_4_10_14_0_8_um_filter_43_12]|nr:MAG: hypothetical protein COY81_01725 [Candidatus Pacebacteria bacterium CG_4_10_14_0_8_um_filter_43_12]
MSQTATATKTSKKGTAKKAAPAEKKIEKKIVKPEVRKTSTTRKPAKKVTSAPTPVKETKKAAVETKPAVKPKTAPVAVVVASQPKTMEELLKTTNYKMFVAQKGQTIKGRITAIGRKSMNIDTGGKTEGIVADKEFDMAKDYITALKVGDEIEAQVVSEENNLGQVLLSLKQAAFDARWDYFTQAMKDDQELEAKGVDVNKGGLIVLVNGVRGFVPSSQFGKELVGKYMQLRGKTIQVKAIEVDREKNRLIFSERHVSEADEIAQKSQALNAVKIREIYEGVVSGVMPFGLFVTVEVPLAKATKDKEETRGQVEGLVHISEISWEKVAHPRDYHKIGDRLKVRVLGLDERTSKLNLSIKQLSDDPWVGIDKRYEVGMSISGTVSRMESFGAFINVEPGIDGLIHSSKLDPDSQLKKGDKVTVNVESVDPEQRRMSLSLVLTELPMGYK